MNTDVLQKRIRLPELREKVTSPEAAAEYIKDGMKVGMSGFTLAGSVKSVPHAIVKRAANTSSKNFGRHQVHHWDNDVDSAMAQCRHHVQTRTVPD